MSTGIHRKEMVRGLRGWPVLGRSSARGSRVSGWVSSGKDKVALTESEQAARAAGLWNRAFESTAQSGAGIRRGADCATRVPCSE